MSIETNIQTAKDFFRDQQRRQGESAGAGRSGHRVNYRR